MLSVLSVLSKLFVCGFLLFVFGYFESHSTTGVIVSIAIASYLTVFRSSTGSFTKLVVFFLLVSEIAGRISDLKLVIFGSFLVLNLVLLKELLVSKESNDLLVKMKPCEKEIRAILFERDPSVLHRVDLWLEKHKGHERELLEKVKQKYLREPDTSSEEEQTGSESEEEEEEAPPRIQGRPAMAAHTVRVTHNQRTPTSAASPAMRPQANPNFYYTPQQKEVLALIQQYDPNLLEGAHRLLADYRGRENELLHQLRSEYGLTLDPLPPSSSSSRGMHSSQSYRFNSPPQGGGGGGGVQLSNSYTALDGVMRDYYGTPQFGKTSPVSGPFSGPHSSYYSSSASARAGGDAVHRNRYYN